MLVLIDDLIFIYLVILLIFHLVGILVFFLIDLFLIDFFFRLNLFAIAFLTFTKLIFCTPICSFFTFGLYRNACSGSFLYF